MHARAKLTESSAPPSGFPNGRNCLTWHLLQNVVLVSIPSVMDKSMAPAGKHTLHAYLPATEPFALWKGKSYTHKNFH